MVHDVTVSVSVPEPEVVVAERAMRRNGGGLGGGCLSGGWQSSAPWRGEEGSSQRPAFEDGVGVDIGRKDPVGCLRGAKVLGGQLGVSILETTEG